MSEPINLRQARKAKARREKEDAAASARAKHGQSKTEKTARKAETDKAGRALDGHKRDRDQK